MGAQLYTDDQVAYLMALAFDAGRWHELEHIAEGHAELEAAWRPIGRTSHAQRVGERLAEMAAAAQRSNERMGRRPGWTSPGGPVDWHTGRPVSGPARVKPTHHTQQQGAAA